VSTAYYAVFHAITDRVSATVFPTANPIVRGRVRRWIGHGDVRTVSLWVGQLQGTTPGNPPRAILALGATASGSPFVAPETALIADGFLELNDKRELADYDHEAIFTRADTRGHLELAHSVVDAVERARSDEAGCFFGLIALQARIQGR
jgi:hypothetical protein